MSARHKPRPSPSAPEPTPWLALALLLAVAAFLIFWNLGHTAIWEDEGQTAVIAVHILHTGVPAASDGKNLVTIFPDHRDIRAGIYIWQGWLPAYLAAASIALFGQNAFAARLPFALASLGFLAFFFYFLRAWARGAGRLHLWLTLGLTLTSIPWLLHARQCRYYALVPLLYLLILHAYLRCLRAPRLQHWLALGLAATALIHTFLPGAALLALALGLDLLRRRPPGDLVKKYALTAVAVLALYLPAAWFCRVWDRRFSPQTGYDSPAVFAHYLLRYLLTLNNYFFPFSLILLALTARWSALRQRAAAAGDLTALFLLLGLTQILGFSLLADFPFTRYLIGTVPFVAYFGALILQALSCGRTWIAWSIFALLSATNFLHLLPLPLLRQTHLQQAKWTTAGINPDYLQRGAIGLSFARGESRQLIQLPPAFPLLDYLRALMHPPPGPIDHLLHYLNQHAHPADRVKISYGDLPLMFHTRLAIVSSADIGPPAPQWMIFRHFGEMQMDRDFVRATSQRQYEKITLPFPDLQWNNQPDPLYHYYRPPPPDLAPPITLLRRH